MWAARAWGPRYWAARYWPKVGAFAVPVALPTRELAIRRLRQGPTLGADYGQYIRFAQFTLDLETAPPRS